VEVAACKQKARACCITRGISLQKCSELAGGTRGEGCGVVSEKEDHLQRLSMVIWYTLLSHTEEEFVLRYEVLKKISHLRAAHCVHGAYMVGPLPLQVPFPTHILASPERL